MRLKKLHEYYIMQRRIIQDEREGGRHEGFSDVPLPVMAHIYDKSSQVTNTAGGITRERTKLMLIDKPHEVVYDTASRQEAYVLEDMVKLQAGDGVCVYTIPEQGPDFRIREISNPGHLECMLERIG